MNPNVTRLILTRVINYAAASFFVCTTGLDRLHNCIIMHKEMTKSACRGEDTEISSTTLSAEEPGMR